MRSATQTALTQAKSRGSLMHSLNKDIRPSYNQVTITKMITYTFNDIFLSIGFVLIACYISRVPNQSH